MEIVEEVRKILEGWLEIYSMKMKMWVIKLVMLKDELVVVVVDRCRHC